MLPFENSPDLLFYPCPSCPQMSMHRVRPYRATDKDAVYRICLGTYQDDADGQNLRVDYPGDLLPDKLVRPFLTYSAENCFVVIDHRDEVCGFVLTAPDANAFHNDVISRTAPQFMEKYALHEDPCTLHEDPHDVPQHQEIITPFHVPFKPTDVPADWFQTVVYISILSDRNDPVLADTSVVKRAFACAVSALKILGSRSVYTCVSSKHDNSIQMYKNIGFFDLPPSKDSFADENVKLLGRFI